MYCTTPSGTRYQIGSPLATRARQPVDEMVSAGISIRLTFPSGRPVTVSRCPGRVQLAQRVDGVGDAGPVDVHPADREPRVRRGRDHGHQVPVLAGRGRLLILPPPG